MSRFKLPTALDLKGMRTSRLLSMSQVQSSCGVSKSTISRIEKGRDADYSNIQKLVEFYQSIPLHNQTEKCTYCKSETPCQGSYPEGCFHKFIRKALREENE